MNEDVILIEELELQTRIGVPAEERAQPQRLLLSLALWPNRGFAEMRDALERSVDYAAVAHAAQQFAAGRETKLLETFADELATHLLCAFPLGRVQLELRKFILPETKYVAVRLVRDRN